MGCLIFICMSENEASMMVGPSTADLASFLTSLSQPAPTGDEASRLDRITVLEQIKAAAAAEQAR